MNDIMRILRPVWEKPQVSLKRHVTEPRKDTAIYLFSVGCTCWTLATRGGGYNVAAILRLRHFSLKWFLCVHVSVPLLWLFPFEEILQANAGVEKCVSFSWVMCCLGRLCLFFFICPPLVYCYRLCVYFCPFIGHCPFRYFWLSSVTLPFS